MQLVHRKTKNCYSFNFPLLFGIIIHSNHFRKYVQKSKIVSGRKLTGGVLMSKCKVDTALEAIVGKWKHKILYHLMQQEKIRFNELKRLIPGITQKMLASQLRELEDHDLIVRKVHAQIPPKVEYSLSEHGKSLIPLLQMMNEWGELHNQHIQSLYQKTNDQA